MTQTEYLKKAKAALKKLHAGHRELSELWAQADTADINLNDFLSFQYPFRHKSFDDLLIDINIWVEDGSTKIDRAINNLNQKTITK